MILMCLMSLCLVLVNYITTIQVALKAKYIHSNELSVIIENGLTLTDLSKSANIIFGKLLALEYLLIMIMNVVGTFLGLNIFRAFSTFEPTQILISFGGISVVTTYAIKFYSYARVGQNLCNAYYEINDGLGKLLMSDGICDKQRRELEFLVNRFSITSPIRPMDMFDMNYAHLAVLNNIIFTYNIILMQFKGY